MTELCKQHSPNLFTKQVKKWKSTFNGAPYENCNCFMERSLTESIELKAVLKFKCVFLRNTICLSEQNVFLLSNTINSQNIYLFLMKIFISLYFLCLVFTCLHALYGLKQFSEMLSILLSTGCILNLYTSSLYIYVLLEG